MPSSRTIGILNSDCSPEPASSVWRGPLTVSHEVGVSGCRARHNCSLLLWCLPAVLQGRVEVLGGVCLLTLLLAQCVTSGELAVLASCCVSCDHVIIDHCGDGTVGAQSQGVTGKPGS